MDYDEGNVTWTDQQASMNVDPNEGPSKQQALIKFSKYLQHFRAEGARGNLISYSDALNKDGTQLRVDLQHLKAFSEELGAWLEEDPAEYLPSLEQAAIARLEADQVQSSDDPDAVKDFSNLQVLLHSSENFGPNSIRELTADNVALLVKIPGIITAAAKPKLKATQLMLQCSKCGTTKRITCKPGIAGVSVPRNCDAVPVGSGGAECPSDPFQVVVDRSTFVDQQQLKLQERPEDVPVGELPRAVTLIADRQLVGQVAPGTRVTITGIYSIYQPKENGQGNNKKDDKAAVAIRMPYIRVVDIQDDSDGDTFTSSFSDQEERDFAQFARSQDPVAEERIVNHMAPGIFGLENIKRAIACLLFGGTRKRMPDGTHRRGDINVLLLGDPSTAKSQFLKFVSKTAPIAVYTSGKGSSAAGLTASVIRDASTGEFYLEGGAMVLADNGVVCIDEFDKMRPEDRVAIHEAMEQQTISIAKAGITTMLKSRAAVLAAANPPSGRYDDMKSAQENIDLQTTILSRFDLIFIVKDERSEERDMQIAHHVLNIHRMAGAQKGPDEEQVKAEAFLKRYLEYARVKVAPRISQRAGETLSAEYVSLREEVRKVAAEGSGELPAVPITVRQLEAIIRIAESLARMTLQEEATEDHVREAIRLFKHSTMDAIKSGIMDSVVFSEEQRAELHSAESQIRRRVAIGAHVSERKLVDELVRIGLPEGLVRRALVFMAQQGEIEHKKERRLVHRLR